jgi:hypothetical protein
LSTAHFEQTYKQGANGGLIAITAPSMALDGDLQGLTLTGARQQSSAPAPSALALIFQAQDVATNAWYSPTPPTVIFESDRILPPVAPFALDANGAPLPLLRARREEVLLDPVLVETRGFGALYVDNSDGDIVVPTGVELKTAAGGSITLAAANLDIQGRVIAPAGALDFTVYNFTPNPLQTLLATPAVTEGRGQFALGAAASLSTAGLILDERPSAPTISSQPSVAKTTAVAADPFTRTVTVTNADTSTFAGGRISIESFSAQFAAGSSIDVSGGLAVDALDERTFGAGGEIEIKTGRDPKIGSLVGGELELGARMTGYSGTTGSSLSIETSTIHIGGETAPAGTLHLSAEFFRVGGFTNYTLTGFGAGTLKSGFVPGVSIAPGTIIEPVAKSFLAVPDESDPRAIALRTLLLPDGLRSPVGLSLNAPGVQDGFLGAPLIRGDLVVGESAIIRTDPLAAVEIGGQTVAVLGSIFAPGGTISITGSSRSNTLPGFKLQGAPTVYLGPQAVLSAAGAVVRTPDARGYRTGHVLPGGSIHIAGNIVADAGTLLDVSGAMAVLDLAPALSGMDAPIAGALNGSVIEPDGRGFAFRGTLAAFTVGTLDGSFTGTPVMPTRVDSDAGSITLEGGQLLYSDATLRGAAGGSVALGGSLSVSSGRFNAAGVVQTPLDVTLTVAQSGEDLPKPFQKSGRAIIGQRLVNESGAFLPTHGFFAANDFLRGGFDSLELNGTVEFSGAVTIDARRSLSVAARTQETSVEGGVIFADSAVTLRAPYIALGQVYEAPLLASRQKSPFVSNDQPFYAPPTFGRGSLTVVADLIDLGNLSLQSIGRADFVAAGGDIRGYGTLDIAGDLTLTAGQIYPPTATTFTIVAYEKNIGIAASTLDSPTVTLASPILPPGFKVGSPLLGSTVQSIDGAKVTLAANANAAISSPTPVIFAPGSGSVTINRSGASQLPLSAAGTLNVYGSTIRQAGVLRAPLGTINLGWDGTGASPRDQLSGAGIVSGRSVVTTRQLTLAAGSETSIAAVDPATGEELTIPYGLNLMGTTWVDPSGREITADSAPGKSINISSINLTDLGGSMIDLRGGGDLFAYRWVPGNGGSRDVLDTSESFAVLSGYAPNFAPYAANNSTSDPNNLARDDGGYANHELSVGDRIYLGASDGLPAGFYTLLPARYALMSGAFLVTPRASLPVGTFTLSDNSNLVTGYRFNDLAGTPSSHLFARFQVSSGDVVRARSEYEDYFANSFFRDQATDLGSQIPRLPTDAGRLILSGARSLVLQGGVLGQAANGRGALIDISTPRDIVISAGGTDAGPGIVSLSAQVLNGFGAESLLIGGTREFGAKGTTIIVKTSNLTVDNAGPPLRGSEIVLVANEKLTLADGAAVVASDDLVSLPSERLLLGDAATSGSGDGTLLRVSGTEASVVRAGVTTSAAPTLSIGAGALVSGTNLTLDSTSTTFLDPTGTLTGENLALSGGRISIRLSRPGALQENPGLVLAGPALENLQAAARLSLTSYSSLDLYGTGEFSVGNLALHVGEIRGFNQGDGAVTLAGGTISLDNLSAVTGPGPAVTPSSGTLIFNAGTIRLGANQLNVDQYSTIELRASRNVVAQGAGDFATQGDLLVRTPLVTAARLADHGVTAAGILTLKTPKGAAAAVSAGGLAAQLALTGTSIVQDSNIVLPSGTVTLRATTGDVAVGGRIDVRGTVQNIFEITGYTDGGRINLVSDQGDVSIGDGSAVVVGAAPRGGNAGTVSVNAAQGSFSIASDTLAGRGGVGGKNGTFLLDAATVPDGSVASIDATLNEGGFTESRDLRVRIGDVTVNGTATARHYRLSADQGSISVSGRINASGPHGGTIDLVANGGVTLLAGSELTVAAKDFDNAGKGGAISLEAGSSRNGVAGNGAVEIRGADGDAAAAKIVLSVASNTAGSAALGDLTGTLHLRAPQINGGTDLNVATIDGEIIDASRITIEGYRIYLPASGSIDSVTGAVLTNGNTFAGAAGTTGAGYTAMRDRLFANNAALIPAVSIQPGAEIISLNGDLTLANNWNLATYRFGPDSAPGVLTLRAAGNLNFNHRASLSDGFGGASQFGLWDAPLLAPGTQSWSYRLVAGADLAAADFRQVQSLANLGASGGSLLLGRNAPALPTVTATNRSAIIPNFYQTIRTGTGSIDIVTGRDVRLLNPLATIYTAGTQATAMAEADAPLLGYSSGPLGNQQTPIYPAQYSLGGGNVTIVAQNDIGHFLGTQLLPDSTRELPNNWLYRRGYVNPATGLFDRTQLGGDIASTSWWIDFSNFFEGVGALGGGNVTMIAGRDIANVDAVVPTNARMPGYSDATKTTVVGPDASKLLELGGGDLLVRTGRDLNGGVYYVERGTGRIEAGNEIRTNATRAAVNRVLASAAAEDPTTWLPTTLYLGKGSFDVRAGGDLLLGPVVNAFLLPQGINNNFNKKTYFSTYAADNLVSVTSLTGDLTIKDSAVGGAGSLANWFANVLLSFQNSNSYSSSQPWLRLAESNVASFATATSLMPSSLRATAFSRDINLVGTMNLWPSPTGTLDLVASGSINGLQPNSIDTGLFTWASSSINLSDADPARLPSLTTPLAIASPGPLTNSTLFADFNLSFAESGSTTGVYGVIQTQQALHSSGPLHADDPNPVRLYARTGDISGLTLYSPKVTRVLAGNDILDVSLYLQNVAEADESVVSAGRDIILYAPGSPLRQAAQASGNQLRSFESGASAPASGSPTAGDLQIGGPGTLQVLAGRDLDLGDGPNNIDGTGVGLVSIGNARNPNLPFEGASIIAGAGLGGPAALGENPALDFETFKTQFLKTSGAGAINYLDQLGFEDGEFEKLSDEEQAGVALKVFFLVLRDAGRDFNTPGRPGFGNYDAGFAAISQLFDATSGKGDIETRSRDIRTKAGGSISLLAPGGDLTLQTSNTGSTLAPPGVITEGGGSISVFTEGDVDLGISRIFTLRGGDIIMWSSAGDIAAGSSAKTVQSAPPTRVIVDAQSGDVRTDIAGLATGGGIGVLATAGGVVPGNVDLIAPKGTVDAGDAGIQATGNLNIAAVQVLNADNILVAGTSVGTPTPPTVAAPNLAGFAAASNTNAAANSAANEVARQTRPEAVPQDELPSIITVEVLGYGGGEDSETDATGNAL